jgi:hypothetical protein
MKELCMKKEEAGTGIGKQAVRKYNSIHNRFSNCVLKSRI